MPTFALPHARTLIAAVLGLVLAIGLIVTPSSATATQTVSDTAVPASASTALVTDGFRPGNIISDEVFFNSGTLSAAQIDSFLKGKVTKCQSGYTCLKDYRQSTANRAADAYCKGYQGASNESAAQIIAKTAQSCGINPQVLLVMIEKEQSLVTHTWPSDWRYTKAFGMACPDTAPCDSAYAGFFNQLYGAARQMKIYAEGKYFTYYAPGKTWNVRYHPNASCGSSKVYIENIATAALYYYTPYQPNAAALRAGFGIGDSCSSYGNRNFYSLFTQWFGSTHAPTTKVADGLIRAQGAAETYLVSGGVKHYITAISDLNLLQSRLGAPRTVTAAAVNQLPTGARFIRLARDEQSGAIYLLEPDGTKHHFATSALIRQYGFQITDYTPLSAVLVAAFPTGGAVGNFFKSETSDAYYKWENDTRRYIASALAWKQQSGSSNPHVAVLPAGNAAYPAAGTAILPVGSLIREASRAEIYFTGSGTEMTYIGSWGLVAEAGLGALTTVADGSLKGYKNVGTLSPVVVCSSGVRVASGGAYRPATAIADAKLRLPDSLCGSLRTSSTPITTTIVVKSQGADPLYHIENGTRRHLRTMESLRALYARGAVTTLTWSWDTVSALAAGAPYLAEGAFVAFAGAPEVYRVEGGALRHVTTADKLLSLAGGRWPAIETLSASFKASYTIGAAF